MAPSETACTHLIAAYYIFVYPKG